MPPAIGEAYVGPTTLNLRDELAPRASVTATVHHGDRLEIIERLRKFVKARTESGEVGWADGDLLLTPEQMDRLRRKREQARKLPSQGKATPFDLVNVHIAPNRDAPSFFQIHEGDKVDMIGHRVMPRVAYNPELDGKTPDAPPGTRYDPWSLVRFSDGRSGWVLSTMIMMAIPDEVAQYAEGHHISSYFSLGTVMDGAEEKHHWLWTTIGSRLEPYDFDSFRIFIYNARRRRYETAYIERNLKGYYPVEVLPATDPHELPGFSLIFSGKDDVLYKRTYQFKGYHLHVVNKQPWSLPPAEPDEPEPPSVQPAASSGSGGSWVSRLKRRVAGWF